jgi:hypothetical protein
MIKIEDQKNKHFFSDLTPIGCNSALNKRTLIK